jgi:Zn-dependent protease
MPEPTADEDDFVAGVERRRVDQEYQAALAALRNPKRRSRDGLLLIGSLALFVIARQGQASPRGVAILVAVLLFHELGHFAGMRLFGYQDVRMFFIPFFGAAVSGRRRGVAAWKEGAVLLLGPVPGVLLALGIASSQQVLSPVARDLAVSLVSINAFNLMPLAGLDGARFLEHLVFSRWRRLDIAFRVCAALALGAVALAWGSIVLGVFALWMVIVLQFRARVLGAAARLRAANLPLPDDPRALDGEVGLAIFKEARAFVPASRAMKPEATAVWMEQIVEAAAARPASAASTIALLLAWLLAGLLAFVTLGLVFRAR